MQTLLGLFILQSNPLCTSRLKKGCTTPLERVSVSYLFIDIVHLYMRKPLRYIKK